MDGGDPNHHKPTRAFGSYSGHVLTFLGPVLVISPLVVPSLVSSLGVGFDTLADRYLA